MSPRRPNKQRKAEPYRHPDAESAMRPEVGTQSQFKKRKAPVTYRFDSSLSPELEWDEGGAREMGEWLLAQIEAASVLEAPHKFDKPREFKGADGQVLVSVASLGEAVEELKRISKPFLNWTGKAEQLSMEVPTLPLFVHERLSTKAIIETLRTHKKDKGPEQMTLFGDPQHSIADQLLKAYEYKDEWVNRMILGDSLVVMNSLLHYEGMGGQVQMIYIDPPYGVKFDSNFQPFVRSRSVEHGKDESLTREPEMVKAYRDTWELGLHSYLSYLRERLLLARELLNESGSVFVQIGEQNVHHVRELLDELFGPDNFVRTITWRSTVSSSDKFLPQVTSYLLWFSKNKDKLKSRALYQIRQAGKEGATQYNWIELKDGSRRRLAADEKRGDVLIPKGRIFRVSSLYSQHPSKTRTFDFEYKKKVFHPGMNRQWATDLEGLKELEKKNLLIDIGNTLGWVLYLDQVPTYSLLNVWNDTVKSGFVGQNFYVVQTVNKVIERCILSSTDPGDLILDPTCGSGTTAYCAEKWGRRWLTVDVSRVPLALARQRLLTATYPWFDLIDNDRGPVGGLSFKRKKGREGRETGGVIPKITLKSIVKGTRTDEIVLFDKPEKDASITRVTGPFTVEATIPTPMDLEEAGGEVTGLESEEYGDFVERLLEVLRQSPVLQLEGNRQATVKQVRRPAKTLALSAEALDEDKKPVAFVFGPENGAVSQKLVYEAAFEANAKGYSQLYVLGFAIQPHARKLVDECEETMGIPAAYVQVTPDVMMGDLLKNMRSSQIFSVCGLPEIEVRKAEKKDHLEVELLGYDLFDPATMETEHRTGKDVPAWFLDTDYNGLCFHVSQAFFPRTGAWNSIKKALKASHDETVWEHLAGTVSAPFESGEHRTVAVKVIDDRGNELIAIKELED